MNEDPSCALSPTYLQLLQTCIQHNTANGKELVRLLSRSVHTIHSEFRDILGIMGVHSRFAAIIIALKKGWVNLGE